MPGPSIPEPEPSCCQGNWLTLGGTQLEIPFSWGPPWFIPKNQGHLLTIHVGQQECGKSYFWDVWEDFYVFFCSQHHNLYGTPRCPPSLWIPNTSIQTFQWSFPGIPINHPMRNTDEATLLWISPCPIGDGFGESCPMGGTEYSKHGKKMGMFFWETGWVVSNTPWKINMEPKRLGRWCSFSKVPC